MILLSVISQMVEEREERYAVLLSKGFRYWGFAIPNPYRRICNPMKYLKRMGIFRRRRISLFQLYFIQKSPMPPLFNEVVPYWIYVSKGGIDPYLAEGIS